LRFGWRCGRFSQGIRSFLNPWRKNPAWLKRNQVEHISLFLLQKANQSWFYASRRYSITQSYFILLKSSKKHFHYLSLLIAKLACWSVGLRLIVYWASGRQEALCLQHIRYHRILNTIADPPSTRSWRALLARS